MKFAKSFQERSRLALETLSKQPHVTLEEAKAQAKRVQERILSLLPQTIDEKESHVAYIVRLPDGRDIAKRKGIENLFDEYLEDIRKRLPDISRREWLFLRIQEFALRKNITDQERVLHKEYLNCGEREETFDQYIQWKNSSK